ncbi:MAG: hypothetical protein L0H84_07625 [Pseudonocardia sp.]|nr:hypothetical protein [Pseudonocardia sp.]
MGNVPSGRSRRRGQPAEAAALVETVRDRLIRGGQDGLPDLLVRRPLSRTGSARTTAVREAGRRT